MENSTKLLPASCPALMWRLLIPNQMVPNFTVPICWSKAIDITFFIVCLYPNPCALPFYNWLQVGLYLQGCDVDWRRQARSVFHVRPPPLRHLRASIFPTFQQERRTFVTPAVWNSLFPRSIKPNAKQKTPKQKEKRLRRPLLTLSYSPTSQANYKNDIFLHSPK